MHGPHSSRGGAPLVVVRTGLWAPPDGRHATAAALPIIRLTGAFIDETRSLSEAQRRQTNAAAARVSAAALRIALPAAERATGCLVSLWVFFALLLAVFALSVYATVVLSDLRLIAWLFVGEMAVVVGRAELVRRVWYAHVQRHCAAALQGVLLSAPPNKRAPSPAQRHPSGREGHDGVPLRELDDEALLEVIAHTLARSGLRAEVERQSVFRCCYDCAYSRAAWLRCWRTRRCQPEFLILSTFNFLFYDDDGLAVRAGAASGYSAPSAAAVEGATPRCGAGRGDASEEGSRLLTEP
jgi:hypothetical protein